MHLSDLQMKMVVSTHGKHLGVIVDAQIDDKGQITNFTIMNKGFKRMFKNEGDLSVNFRQIVNIGEDVILVDL